MYLKSDRSIFFSKCTWFEIKARSGLCFINLVCNIFGSNLNLELGIIHNYRHDFESYIQMCNSKALNLDMILNQTQVIIRL